MNENTIKYEIMAGNPYNLIINGETKTVYRIKSIKSFLNNGFKVEAGDIGGWVESKNNLDQLGNCWIDPASFVTGKSVIRGNALIINSSIDDEVYISKNVVVKNSKIGGKADIYGNMEISNMYLNYGGKTVIGVFNDEYIGKPRTSRSVYHNVSETIETDEVKND